MMIASTSRSASTASSVGRSRQSYVLAKAARFSAERLVQATMLRPVPRPAASARVLPHRPVPTAATLTVIGTPRGPSYPGKRRGCQRARPVLKEGRHDDRLGRADHPRRRARAPRRCLPAARRRRVSRHHLLRPVRQVAPLRGSLHRSVAPHGRAAPRRRGRIDEQVPELGGRRSREVGARRLRLRAGGLAGLRSLARSCRSVVGARGAGLLRVHRVGGAPALSNGKVGANGISYYAMNQWQVAVLQPPHLAAICIWEGAADYYRDLSHHGGILCTFGRAWFPSQVVRVQHGRGARGYRSRMNGDWVSGPPTLREEGLGANRRDFYEDCLENPLATDAYWRSRMPDWSKVKVPLFSAANWGGQPLHPRGNFEGFVRAASKQKWLEVHGIEHWTHFYTDYGRKLQLEFFDHFLHGKKNGWDKHPRVLLQVRHIDRFVERSENEWPLARTRWTRFYLDPSDCSLSENRAVKKAVASFEALGDGLTFLTAPLGSDMEITGPSALKLFVSSSTEDAYLFVVLRVFSPDLKEVVFQGAIDPHTPIGQGWLRASHRRLDNKLSTPYRPYHTHDKAQPLKKGEVAELDIEIWPTSIVVPAGHRVALTIRGKDYVYGGPSGGKLSNFKNELTGCGPFLHDDPRDRPAAVFGGVTGLHAGRDKQPYLLLPVIPPKKP